jgi:hypothetical protein
VKFYADYTNLLDPHWLGKLKMAFDE